ncbi:MAG: hypothetical protein J5766_00735 [Clostridia bacterium]|nr:hypothetical protein [Clostridia bacterium]
MIKLLSNLTFKKLIYNKKFLIAVSVIISIVIWFVAAIVRNPIREKTFSDVVASITLDGTAASEKNLKIISDVSEYRFKVTVKGATHVVSGMSKDAFTLKADVSDITEPNDHCVLKIVPEKLDSREYEFVSIEPSTVTVKIVRFAVDEYDLTAGTSKAIATNVENGLIAELPVLTDTTTNKIKVTGSTTALAKIKSVVAEPDYDGSVLTESKTFDAYIVIYTSSGDNSDASEILYKYNLDGTVVDSTGNVVKNPELTPEFTKTKVTVNILKKATLPVTPVYDNLPSDVKESDINATVSPDTVTVVGPPDVISGLKQIFLEPIDYKSISSDYTNRSFKRKAKLVSGVMISEDEDNKTTFTVKIKSIAGNRYYK